MDSPDRAQDQNMPVAWTNEAQLGYLKDLTYAQVPMAMWASRSDSSPIPLYAALVAPVQAPAQRESLVECPTCRRRWQPGEHCELVTCSLRAQRENMLIAKGPDDCAEHMLLQARQKGQEHWTNIYAAQLSQFVGYGCEVRALASPVQVDGIKEKVAQALLDRFIDRGRVRIQGPTFPAGSKMADLPSSYSDDFYMDADAILAALAQGSISDQESAPQLRTSQQAEMQPNGDTAGCGADTGGGVRWARVNDEPFEYAIQQGPHGDEFVKLINGTCLRRGISDQVETKPPPFIAALLTTLDVMKSAHSRGGDRLMSVWTRDVQAVEAAVEALSVVKGHGT